MATINSINANQLLGTAASPSFAGLTVGSSSGIAKLTAGVVGTATAATDYIAGGQGASTQIAVFSASGTLGAGDTFTYSAGALTVGKVSATTGSVALANASSANLTTIQAGNATSAVTYTLPVDAPAGNGYHLACATDGTMTWNAPPATVTFTVITADQSAAENKGYIANKAGTAATITLPATAAVGTVLEVVGLGATGWIVAQNALQSIKIGTSATTVGVGGSLASTQANDTLRMVCAVADTTWVVTSMMGNVTVV